jgi:hypothetical protein
MATTSNYSWQTPDNTSYVKDGASAIRTLGSSVDTTLFTALGGAYPGLRLIKKQTIGTAVTSVSVTSAFSATYTDYKVIVTDGVGSANIQLLFSLNGITSGYNNNLQYNAFGSSSALAASVPNSTTVNWSGSATSSNIQLDLTVKSPFLSKNKFVAGTYNEMFTAGGISGNMQSFVNSTASATGFTIACNSGSLTGGTVYVYGYGAS